MSLAAPVTPEQGKPLPSKNPIPLSAAQESEVHQLFYRRVRHICQHEIREFATCALGKTFSAAWACRTQRKVMNDCLIVNDTQEHRDRAREDWFAARAEKARAKQEQEGLAEGPKQ